MTPKTIVVDTLEVRAVPGEKTTVLTTLHAGDRVGLLHHSVAIGRDIWQAVELGTRQLGWVPSTSQDKPVLG